MRDHPCASPGPRGSSRRIFLHGQCHIFCPPTVIIFYILPKYLPLSNFHSKYFLMSINWCIIIFHRSQFLINKMTGFYLQDILQPEHSHLLERSFTVRFRCLLDNTSGFLVNATIKMFYSTVKMFFSLSVSISEGKSSRFMVRIGKQKSPWLCSASVHPLARQVYWKCLRRKLCSSPNTNWT